MISIVTITYNRAHLIRETIQSVLNQSYTDFEYIIVDDGSEDNTEAVVNEFKDQRIKYFRLSKIGYLSKLRNFGFKKAIGKYIALIDSDDLWDKEKLKIQFDILEEDPSIGFCFSDVVLFRDSIIMKERIYIKHKEGSLYKGYMFNDYISSKLSIYSSSTIVFRKECYNHVGELDESLRSGDHNFICRLLLHYKGCAVYRSLARIRRHNHNHSDLAGNLPFEEYIISLDRFYNQKIISKKVYKRMVSNNHYQSGILFSRNHLYNAARKAFIKSFKIHPMNYKGLVRYFMHLFK